MASPRRPSASGRFVLRLPPPLHAALQEAARASGLSLNEYCMRRLSVAGSALALDVEASAVVVRAAGLVGDALAGVVVYGSWARGEATPTSDVDVLIVVASQVALTRALYRAWDEQPVTWQGRPVDPHFVHPPPERVEGGAWAEAALDGILVFERGLRVSRELARIRRMIADGRLVRRRAHGQPYWTVAA